MKRHHRWAASLLVILLLTLYSAAVAAEQAPEGRVLKVAFPDLKGISEIDRNGNHVGLLVDYLNEIAKYTGWEYDYIQVDNEDMIQNFMDGEYDLMGGTYYSPGFEEYFAYPAYNTGRSRSVLLCRIDDESLRGYDLASLNGKTIGVYENATEKIRYLKEFLVSNDLECQLRYYSYEDMKDDGNLYQKLRDGEVDMLLGNDLEIGGEFRMLTSFQAQPYYIVTTVGNTEVLDGLNTALQSILESTPDFSEKAYSVHFPDVKLTDVQFNDQELRYIAMRETLTVAVPSNWHPFFCLENPADHHDGLIPDLFEKISSFTGLGFTYVYADSYADAIQLVQEGKADILGVYLDGEEQAFSDGLALSQPYISMNNIVLKNKSVSYPGPDLTCGVLAGRTLPPGFQAVQTHSYATVSEMVAAVNAGEVDYIYGVSAILEQEMQNHRYLNVVPVTLQSDNTNASFAITRPVTPELLTVLNKAIGNISTEEKNNLLNQNLVSLGYTNLSLRELIYANPVAFILILVVVLLPVTVGVSLIVRGRVKNALMQSKIKAAEAKSLAKSEFLSQMSHEIRTPMNAIVGLTDLTILEHDLPPDIEKKLKKIRSSSRYLLSLINDILDMSRIENGKMGIERENFSITVLLEELQGMMSIQAEQKGLRFQSFCQINCEWLLGDAIRLRQILTNLLSNAIKFTPSGGRVTLRVDEIAREGQTVEYRFSVEDTGVGIPPEDQERIFIAFEQLTPSTSRSAGTGLGLPISRSIARLMGGDLQVKSEPGKGSEFYLTLRFPLGTGAAAQQPESFGNGRQLNGVRILLAEDNDLNAEIAVELLSKQGIQVSRAANGQEAVDLFESSPLGNFQAILMDIQMPVKDGHEAAREIRASSRADAEIPIIAMTANTFKEDEEAARAAGMNGFIPKPVDPNRLFSVLQEFL